MTTPSTLRQRLMAAIGSGAFQAWRHSEAPLLPGLPIAVWRGEEFDAVVCVRCDDDHPLLMLDNLIGECGRCAGRVQFRPTSPPGPRLCVECALALVGE